MRVLNEQWVEKYNSLLGINPFEDDFGESGDKCLSDKIVIANKDHIGKCSECGGDCLIGTANRVMTYRYQYDGIVNYRFCEKCIDEQLASEEQDLEDEDGKV